MVKSAYRHARHGVLGLGSVASSSALAGMVNGPWGSWRFPVDWLTAPATLSDHSSRLLSRSGTFPRPHALAPLGRQAPAASCALPGPGSGWFVFTGQEPKPPCTVWWGFITMHVMPGVLHLLSSASLPLGLLLSWQCERRPANQPEEADGEEPSTGRTARRARTQPLIWHPGCGCGAQPW